MKAITEQEANNLIEQGKKETRKCLKKAEK